MDVTDNQAERRFELATDAGPAIAAYALDGDTITFTHTVVPPEAEGQGRRQHADRRRAGGRAGARAEGGAAMRVRRRLSEASPGRGELA